MTPAGSTALIVGGGIAGLASAIALGRVGWRCTLLERDLDRRRVGQGLLMPPSGRRALEQLGLRRIDAFTAPIDGFALCHRDGRPLQHFPIPGSMAVLHRDLLELLWQALPAGTELVSSRCIGLEGNAEDELELIDAEGRRWRRDLIVAADGVGSLCRRALFPWAQLTPERTTEIVLVLKNPELAGSLGHCCRKYQDPEAGLALGLLPCRNGQIVVFSQFATAIHAPGIGSDAAALLRSSFAGWNPLLDRLLADIDTAEMRFWHTTDLDPLPQLHQGHLVLVGDSAHPLLTFTSQGASSALQDALELSDQLKAVRPEQPGELNAALGRYSRLRRPQLVQLVEEGRQKQRKFLDPTCNGVAGPPLVGFDAQLSIAP